MDSSPGLKTKWFSFPSLFTFTFPEINVTFTLSSSTKVDTLKEVPSAVVVIPLATTVKECRESLFTVKKASPSKNICRLSTKSTAYSILLSEFKNTVEPSDKYTFVFCPGGLYLVTISAISEAIGAGVSIGEERRRKIDAAAPTNKTLQATFSQNEIVF